MNTGKSRPLLISLTLAALLLTIIIVAVAFNPEILPEKPPAESVNESPAPKKNIVFSFGGLDFNDNLKTQISLFMEANPDIEVKILQLPNSTDYQKNSYASALRAGDDSIDVISTDIIWTQEFASNGWLLPLDNYFTEEMQTEFIQSAVDGCRYNGRVYAVPKKSDVPLLYYRSDIIPKPPETIDEMVELVKKYKASSGVKYGFVFQGGLYEGLVCCTLDIIWAYGGDVVRDGKILINTPESRMGLQKLVDMMYDGTSSPDILKFIEDDSMIAFKDGNALFMRNWPYAYRQLNEEGSLVAGKVRVCQLPMGDTNIRRTSGTFGGWNYAINSNSKYKEEAWRLIEWLTGPEMQVLDYKLGGSPPSRIEVYSNPEVIKIDPLSGQMMTLIENARLRPTPFYPSISEVMQINFSNALHRVIDVETAMGNIEAELQKMIEAN